jgi:hypothetical protein
VEWIKEERESASVHVVVKGEDEEVVASHEVTSDDGWTYTFTGLPKYDSNGSEIEYGVTEDSIDGYTTAVTDPTEVSDTELSFVVINTQLISISGTKVWDDSDDQDGLRPDSVTVNLLQDEEVVDTQTVTVGDGGTWHFSFNGLLKYSLDDEDSHEYTYTVEEADVPDGYTSVVSSDESGHYTITNTHTPATTSVSVSKVWEDGGDQDGLRPDSINVQLYADGEAYGNVITLSSDNAWEHTWSDLDKYSDGEEIEYTVKEVNEPTGYTAAVTGDASSGYTVTNTHTPETVDVPVTKKWVGPEGGAVTVHLYADGVDTSQTLTLSSENDWSGSFDDVAKYSNGNEIAYSVTEDAVENYSTKITGDASSGYTITNTNTETVDVSGTKAWDDSDDQDGLRPDSVTVNLLRDDVVADSQTVTASEDGTWSFSFEDLAKYDPADGHEYAYTVEEADVPQGYTSKVTGSAESGYTVTNTHTPETVDVPVTKKWVGPEGGAVTVHLYADGVDTSQTLTLSSENDWSGSFDDVAKYSNGNEIAYSVTEDAVENYSTKITGDASSGYIITNTNTETVDVSGTVVWNDDGDRDGLRPDLVGVDLLRDGTIADSQKVTAAADGTWSFSFDDLAKYDPTDGHEYTYTVEEATVPDGYTSAITGDASSGYTITNTHTPATTSVSVNKVWKDSKDKDGTRPDSVTVQLYANGSAYGDPVVLSEDNSWAYTWSGLNANNGGKAVAYTVAETDVPDGYKSAITGDAPDGFTITNTHKPKTAAKASKNKNSGLASNAKANQSQSDDDSDASATNASEASSPETSDSTFLLPLVLALALVAAVICVLAVMRRRSARDDSAAHTKK